MAIKALKDMWGLFRELNEVIKVFKYFDQNEEPQKTLEKMIVTAEKTPVFDKFLKFTETRKMVSRAEKRAEKRDWNYACQEAVKEMGVNYEVRGVENIPKKGGVLYVCNHPYGLLDAAILIGGLGSLISKKERELKLIGMNQLRAIKGIEKIVYFVHSTVKKPNMGSVRESLRYIKNGGDLAIYPAGEMSGEKLREYPWKNLKNFISHSSCVVPMWFSGPDHAKRYNFFSKSKKREYWRRAFSFKEAWNKVGETVILNIGKPISSEELEEKGDINKKVKYLRQSAETLKVDV